MKQILPSKMEVPNITILFVKLWLYCLLKKKSENLSKKPIQIEI